MEEYSYEYNVTYTVTLPVTVRTSGDRGAADTIAMTAVAKGLLSAVRDDVESVKTEYVMRRGPFPSEAAVPGRNIFRDSSGEEDDGDED